jgi:O-antigen/teichoic acid export membrane protein
MTIAQQESVSVSIARNSLYVIGAQIISKALTLLFYAIVARHLGDVGIGKYAFILSLVGIATIFANFGFDNLIVRDVALDRLLARKYLLNVCYIKIVLAIAASAILILFISWTQKPPDVVLGVYVICLTIFFEGISNAIESIFNAYEKLKYLAYVEAMINLLKVGLALIIQSQNLGLTQLIWGVVILSLVRVMIDVFIMQSKFFPLHLEFDSTLIRYLVKTAYPFALMGIISVIYFRIDSIMLSFMKTDAEVGWYAASFNLISMLMFISYGLSQAIFPVLSRFYQSSRENFLSIAEKSFHYLLILGLPVALGITILADKIIYFIYGEQFRHSVLALQILIWSIPIIYINSPLLRLLYSANKQHIAMIISFTSMVVNIFLNIVLIPPLSYLGTSISTLASEVVNFILYYAVISRIFSYYIKIDRTAIRSLGALLIMGLFVYFAKDSNLFLVIGCSAVLYFLSLYFLKAFSKYELNLIRSLF